MVTAAKSPLDFLFVLPEPKEITLLGGLTELSEDVRLVTVAVKADYRKTMREVLNNAGIKVVANKKKFIIEVRVEKPELFDMNDVPPAVRKEYYEIELLDNTVTIRTSGQIGSLWGAHTLAGLYHALARGHNIPNMKIRDWPDTTKRAAFLSQRWGMERWTLNEWRSCMDHIAAGKISILGIPLDAGCKVRMNGEAETLVIPMAEKSPLNKETAITWYSPRLKAWRGPSAPPVFQTNPSDTPSTTLPFLTHVVKAALENGITPTPIFNVLGEDTPLPRLVPAIAAKDATGKPGTEHFCLSAPETRKFVGDFYSSILDRYFPLLPLLPDDIERERNGREYVILHVGELPKVGVCLCAACKKKGTAASLADYVSWLVRLLVAKDVRNVVLWDAPVNPPAADRGLAAVMEALNADPDLQGKVVLAGPDMPPAAAPAKSAAKKGKKAEPVPASASLRRWASAPVAFDSWMPQEENRKLITQAAATALASGNEGLFCSVIFDPLFYSPLEFFSNAIWNQQVAATILRKSEEIADLHVNHGKPAYLAARKTIEDAVFGAPGIVSLLQTPAHQHLFSLHDGQFDISTCLASLTAPAGKSLRAQLDKTKQLAVAASQAFQAIQDKEPKPSKPNANIFRCLSSEALRLAGITGSLDAMATVYEGVAKKKLDAAAAITACSAAVTALNEYLLILETICDKQVAPLKMAEFSPFLALLEQMLHDLAELQAGNRKAADIRWAAPLPEPPPGHAKA